MSHLVITRRLPVSPEQAFEACVRLDRIPTWKRGVESVSRTGRMQAGLTYAVRVEGGVKVRYLVTRCDAGLVEQRFAHSGGLWGALLWRVEPATGGCLLTCEAWWSVPEAALVETGFADPEQVLAVADRRALVDAALETELRREARDLAASLVPEREAHAA